MLTKAVVFIFCLIGVFGLLVNSMPSQFSTHQERGDSVQSVTVRSYFTTHDIDVYDNQGTGNMTGEGWENLDIPSGEGAGHYIEMRWRISSGSYSENIQLRHSQDEWYGRSGHDMIFYRNGIAIYHYEDPVFPTRGTSYVTRSDMVNAYSSILGGSYFDIKCDHLDANVLFQTNDSTIGEGWDNDYLGYAMSYQVNLSKSSLSIWGLIGALFSFQAPNLGLPGLMNTIVGGSITCAMWALVIVVVYKVLTGIIPWLSGGSGD